MDNQFGRTSKLQWRAVEKDGHTILKDIYFTAPYKIMTPFPQKDGSISVMALTASAGVMAGDRADFTFTVETGAKVEFLSQSFEKIHKMEQGTAARVTQIQVAAGGTFFYHPLPVIPFADSSFENNTKVVLEDETAEFEYYEILSCGRSARGERFAYEKYLSKLHIYKGEKLIFRDNAMFLPKQFPMEETGLYEGYTHLANFLFCNRKKDDSWAQQVKELLQNTEAMEGGVTRLESGDYLVKILGHKAQQLQQLGEQLNRI